MGERRPEMGKWLLYQFFHKDPQIAKYLPVTRKYTHENFAEMLSKFRMVYVKPVAGSMGKGIMKVWLDGQNRIVVKKTIERQHTFANKEQAMRYIDTLRQGKMYIVQQGIHMATVGGRPLDIRVMMQREKPGGKWLFSGMLAKIAGGNSIVTNTALSRGRVMDVDKALKEALHWSNDRVSQTITKLQQLGLYWAKHFDSYQLYRELGFDVAVDRNGRIWLIEQNTLPSHALFARNKANLSAYRRIQYRWGVYQRARMNRSLRAQR
ncbi:YheC/YheD family protein [Alicyclobacillus dauci]|uniref:YheC/YheD family protein n=1 Tax=Alicyclobacillus dauci TaxID=1475485 RepID=A0ABY6Z899_9BACL|nr:YheC/YheD family protein [Alicyclobacillus dauci]WAH38474.1 YheC/YheD family protein [Alicyclobacillus dauci]